MAQTPRKPRPRATPRATPRSARVRLDTKPGAMDMDFAALDGAQNGVKKYLTTSDHAQDVKPVNIYNQPPDTLAPDTQDPDLIGLSDGDLVRATLRAIMADTLAPAAAKAQAARTLAEITNQIGRNSEPAPDAARPVRGLSRADLERELAGIAATTPPAKA